jgi:peptidoglycan/LPS O-acetylase OafA/YrhL
LVERLVGYDYSGSLAVKIFFFLSGLVVTNSLLHKRNVLQFLVARFFRIWPALLFVTLGCALLLGPSATALPLGDYFHQVQTYWYVVDNLMLRTDYHLPGVFLTNPHKGIVNGSLWTLPHEVGAYLALLGLFVVGVFRLRVLALGVFVLLLVNPLLPERLLFAWRTPQFEVDLLVPCFAMGAVLALYKERISVGLGAVVGLALLWWLLRSSTYSFYFFYAALFSGILYLSGTRTLLRFKPRSDLSYGVYLWGFPVQQTLLWLIPEQSTLFNQAASLAVALLLGFVSWHLVEKRGIALGQQVIGRLARKHGPLPEVEPKRRQ